MNKYDIDSLDSKIKQIKSELIEENIKLKDLSEIVSLGEYDDPRDEYSAKENYYSHLDEKEKKYQKKNNEYKALISRFSLAYLELSNFYVGPELPRYEETFLDSKNDIESLYFLFIMSLFFN